MGGNAGTDKQQAVVDLARLFGWKVATFRAARTAKGWRTPAGADGKGWCDLVLVRPPEIKFREVKSGSGEVTPEQEAWLKDLRACGQDAGVWRVEDLRTSILEELR